MTVLAIPLPLLSSKATTVCWGNLNKVDWNHGFSFTCYGIRFGVRVSDPALLPMLRKRLPAGATASDAKVVDRYFSVILGGSEGNSRVRRYNIVYVDHVRFARSHDLDDILHSFETAVRLSAAELARNRVFIHAGAVGWNGKAIVLPGKSFVGKTNLVMELVKAGATYYSDEFAVLDSMGRVHPYLKPLSLRENGSGRQRNVPVEEIGGRPGRKPLPVGLVVMSAYKPGARWRPLTLSPGNGALALLSNTVSARRTPERVLATLERMVSMAPVIEGKRGEATVAAQAILESLNSK